LTEDTIEKKVLGDVFSTLFDQKVIGNTMRGFYAEALVAELLGPDWQLVSQDWAGWDLEHVSGLKGEVKQSAALQTWDLLEDNDKEPLSPSFDIAPRKGFWKGLEWTAKPGRIADVYFFCWHDCLDKSITDHRKAGQWKFFIVKSEELPPKQKKIGLGPISKLCPPMLSHQLEQEASRILFGKAINSQIEVTAFVGPRKM
jgi:hypothetical protein